MATSVIDAKDINTLQVVDKQQKPLSSRSEEIMKEVSTMGDGSDVAVPYKRETAHRLACALKLMHPFPSEAHSVGHSDTT